MEENNNLVQLQDENGNDVNFEHLMTVEYEGSYYVVASDADPLTVPAVCQVAVTYVEQVPSTGDNSMISLVVATMSVSMLAVLCIGKKRVF